MSQTPTNNGIIIGGIQFIFVQELTPERNAKGQINQAMPQDRYKKSYASKLNAHGGGPFCKFSIDSEWAGRSGVYALLSNDGLLYIGECADLRSRYNMGYGTISPKNCYQGGQPTNCKINSMVLNQYLCGNKVCLYFHETNDYKQIEDFLIKSLAPPYNGARATVTATYSKKLENRRFDSSNFIDVGIKNSSDSIIGEPSSPAIMTKLNNSDSVLDHLTNIRKKVCDDCISCDCSIYPRQQVNQICNRLVKKGSINRENDMCDICKKEKLVNSIV